MRSETPGGRVRLGNTQRRRKDPAPVKPWIGTCFFAMLNLGAPEPEERRTRATEKAKEFEFSFFKADVYTWVM